jgi:hypothetical protein
MATGRAMLRSMRERLRRHLNPPLVVAVIALFVALGGGYAMAFKGSGTLQKANISGVPSDGSRRTVRTMTGIGVIEAACASGVAGNPDKRIVILFRNTTNKNLVIDSLRSHQGQNSVFEVISANAGAEIGRTLPPIDDMDEPTRSDYTYHWYIQPTRGEGHPLGGGSKRPQADVQLNVFPSEDCAFHRVAALVLNTQQ